MIQIDTMIDMNVTNAAGTAITIPIVTSGTRGLTTTWDVADAGFTVETGVMKMPFPLDVNGVGGFLAGTPSRAIHFSTATGFRILRYVVPASTYTKVTVGGWISFGEPNQGGAGQYFSHVQINTTTAFTSVMLNNGLAVTSSGYGICIAYFTGASTYSDYIEILPNTWYWVTLSSDYVNGVAQLYVYDIDGNQIGTTIYFNFAPIPPSIIYGVVFGNNDAGNVAGTTKYECWILDYLTAQFPLRPFADYFQGELISRPFPFRPGITLTRRT